MKNLHKAAFLLLLLSLAMSCRSDKKLNRGPVVITPKTLLYYPITTKEDLNGTSSRTPIDDVCLKKIKADPNKAITFDQCGFAGDAVMLGKIIAEGDNFGCTDGKLDQFGYRYEYVIKVLHVFAGEYKEKEIRVDIGQSRYQARIAKLGDTIIFSAFHAEDHWFLNTYLVNRPDDDTPFTYQPLLPGEPCPLVELPSKVSELDALFKESTGGSNFDRVCTHELMNLNEQRDYLSHKTDDAGRHPLGPVGKACPFELKFKELKNEN